MKTNKLIIILVILVIIITLFCILFAKENKYSSNTADFKLLVIDTYSNYAYGSQFYGTAILDNGYIYTWKEDNNSNTQKYKIGTSEGLKEYILNEGKRKTKRVSNNDLELIREYVSQIQDDIKITHSGADQGTKSIYVIDEENNEIILKCSGDSNGENTTKEAKELLELIEKYF